MSASPRTPGDEAYGAVSLRLQYFADAKVVGKVPPTVFVPRPNVDSVLVVDLAARARACRPSVVSEDELFSVIRTAFGQRRKMLRRSLAEWTTEGVFERAGVDGTRRPEELTIEEFAASGGGAMIELRAPAKLTWFLEITGPREDGMHELRAEMVTLRLCRSSRRSTNRGRLPAP